MITDILYSSPQRGFGHAPANCISVMSNLLSISRFFVSGIIACMMAGSSLTSPLPPAGNYRTEAQDLHRFAEFVDWPAVENAGTRRTINFCVLGHDPFGAALNEFILGHPIGAWNTVIVRGERLRDLGECDVLFVSPSETASQAKILEQVRGAEVLTVGDTPDFASSGGIIQFVPEDGRVSFLINVDAAKRAGLTIRSSLLALARIVHDRRDKLGD